MWMRLRDLVLLLPLVAGNGICARNETGCCCNSRLQGGKRKAFGRSHASDIDALCEARVSGRVWFEEVSWRSRSCPEATFQHIEIMFSGSIDYAYLHIYIDIDTHIHVHIYIHAYSLVYKNAFFICMFTHVHVYIHTYIYTYMHIYMYTFLHIYTHIYVYAYVPIRIFVHMHAVTCTYMHIRIST